MDAFSAIVGTEFGWLLRKTPQEHDFGIDGFIEVVNGTDVTGKMIAFQLKYGSSYIKTDGNRLKFTGEMKHFNYWANHSLPVLVIVGDPSSNIFHWVRFQPELTDRIGDSSWSIDIPLSNVFGISQKTIINDLAGYPQDYVDEAGFQWAINALLKSEAHPIMYMVGREDVDTGDFNKIDSFFKRLLISREMVQSCKGKIWLSIHGYDDDPRELYEIPEVCKWVKTAEAIVKFWFYFLDPEYRNSGLQLLMSCSSDVKKLGIVNGRYRVTMNPKLRAEYLVRNYGWLNELCETFDISDEVNLEICTKVLTCLEIADPPS